MSLKELVKDTWTYTTGTQNQLDKWIQQTSRAELKAWAFLTLETLAMATAYYFLKDNDSDILYWTIKTPVTMNWAIRIARYTATERTYRQPAEGYIGMIREIFSKSEKNEP